MEGHAGRGYKAKQTALGTPQLALLRGGLRGPPVNNYVLEEIKADSPRYPQVPPVGPGNLGAWTSKPRLTTANPGIQAIGSWARQSRYLGLGTQAKTDDEQS